VRVTHHRHHPTTRGEGRPGTVQAPQNRASSRERM
jgi:fatty acid desaturase